MSLLLPFARPALLLFAGPAAAFAVAVFSFSWYGLLVAKARVSGRVDALLDTFASRASETEDAAGQGGRVFRLQQAKGQSRETTEWARRLEGFGIAQNHAGAFFVAFRLCLGLLLAAVLFVPARHSFAGSSALPLGLAVTFGLAAGWYGPAVFLDTRLRRRVHEIETALPEAIELLIIAVEAGLALEDGIDRIVVELKGSRPSLAEELALTAADLKILPDREQALSNLASRVDVPSVRSVVTTLSQTMRYGTPLAQALRIVAAELRNEALARLEERANRMPVLLTIPMVVFILPAVFIFVGGPALLQVLDIIMR